MSIRVVLELHVKPELADKVKDGFKEQLVDTRAFEGCEEISVIQNQDDPSEILVLEQWDSRQSYEAYLKWRTDRGDMDNIDKISTQPFQVRYYDYVRG